MITAIRLTSLMIAAIVVSGCINSAVSQRSSQDTYQSAILNADQRYIIDEPLVLQQSHTSVGRFNSQMIFMADQIERNVERKSLANTFLVTSFTNLNKLSETTAFGRLVAENIIHELQVRKWKVFEVRLTKDLVINETGEFSLSRDIKIGLIGDKKIRLSRHRLDYHIRINSKKPSKAFQSLDIRG